VSFEGVVDATARVLASVSGMKAAYASTAGGQGDTVKSMPSDITDTPVALVVLGGFQLLSATGSFEKLRCDVIADVYFSATNPGAAEKVALPLLTRCFAAFRTNADVYGQGTIATCDSGGPPRSEVVSGKDYLVFPLNVTVLVASIQLYSQST
jgi:hypothetical protein